MTNDKVKEQYLAVARMEYGEEADKIIQEFIGVTPKDLWVFQEPVQNAIVSLLDRIDGLKKQLAFATRQVDSSTGPVSSGTPCSLDTDNQDKVVPI